MFGVPGDAAVIEDDRAAGFRRAVLAVPPGDEAGRRPSSTATPGSSSSTPDRATDVAGDADCERHRAGGDPAAHAPGADDGAGRGRRRAGRRRHRRCVRHPGHPRRRDGVGRDRHRHGHHRHGGDVAGAVTADAAPRPSSGPAGRLRPGRRWRAWSPPSASNGRRCRCSSSACSCSAPDRPSNLLARYAATDLAEPHERSRAMSRIVFASTFGAVFGPLLIGPAEAAGTAWFGLDRTPDRGCSALVVRRGDAEHRRPIATRSAARVAVRPGGRRSAAPPGSARPSRAIVARPAPARADGDGDLPGDDGGGHGDDADAPQAARPRDRQRVRRVGAHRRHVRVQPAGRALQRPARPAARDPDRRRRCSSRRPSWRRCRATSSSCSSRRCGCSASVGTSA